MALSKATDSITGSSGPQRWGPLFHPLRIRLLKSLAADGVCSKLWHAVLTMGSSIPRLSAVVLNSAGPRSLWLFLAAGSFFAVGCGGHAADSGQNGNAGASAGLCMIAASSYDQSCSADTDCQEVTSTDYCGPHCLCGGSALNVHALAQFNEDVAKKTPLASGSPPTPSCPCIPTSGPCCRAGKCTMTCESASDALPACRDALGACVFGGDGTSCVKAGPPQSCAYSDEVCCL